MFILPRLQRAPEDGLAALLDQPVVHAGAGSADPFEIMHMQGGTPVGPAQVTAPTPAPGASAAPAGPPASAADILAGRVAAPASAAAAPQPASAATPVPGATPQTVDLSEDLLLAGLQSAKGNSAPAAAAAPATGADGNPAAAPVQTPEGENPAYALYYQRMVDDGVWEPVEGFNGTRESLLQAEQHNANRGAQAIADGWFADAFQNNPEGAYKGKALLRHLAAGGNVSDFASLMAPLEVDSAALDSQDATTAESAARGVIQNYYSMINWTPQQISNHITQLEKTGTLVEHGKMVNEPYQQATAQRAAQHQQNLERTRQAQVQEVRRINTELVGLIDAGHSFGPLSVGSTKKEQEAMKSFYFAQDEETGATGFNTKLAQAMKNPKFLAFLGPVLMNDIYEKPELLGAAGGQSGAIDKLEQQLSNALLNKNIGHQTAHSNPSHTPTPSKIKFNLDEAIVVR